MTPTAKLKLYSCCRGRGCVEDDRNCRRIWDNSNGIPFFFRRASTCKSVKSRRQQGQGVLATRLWILSKYLMIHVRWKACGHPWLPLDQTTVSPTLYWSKHMIQQLGTVLLSLELLNVVSVGGCSQRPSELPSTTSPGTSDLVDPCCSCWVSTAVDVVAADPARDRDRISTPSAMSSQSLSSVSSIRSSIATCCEL